MTLRFPAVRDLIASDYGKYGKVTPEIAAKITGEIAGATIEDDIGLEMAGGVLRHISQQLDKLWVIPPINREREVQLTGQYRALRAEIERYTTLRKLLA